MRFILSISFRVSHIFREGNKVAYILANLNLDFGTRFMPIPCIEGQVFLYFYGAEHFRFVTLMSILLFLCSEALTRLISCYLALACGFFRFLWGSVFLFCHLDEYYFSLFRGFNEAHIRLPGLWVLGFRIVLFFF